MRQNLKIYLFTSLLSAVFVQAQSAGFHIPDFGNYRLDSEDGTTQIPFEYYRNHIVVPVQINGKTLRLTLDTGNLMIETVLYGDPKIDSLGLDYQGHVMVGGAGDSPMAPARRAEGVTLSMSGLTLTGQTVTVMPFNPALRMAFEGEDGVFGSSLFHQFTVQVDFERSLLVLKEPSIFTIDDQFQEILVSRKPMGGSYIEASLTQNDKQVPVTLHIDLGSPHAVSINKGVVPELVIPNKNIPLTAFGSQGAFSVRMGRLKNFEVGRFLLSNVITAFSESSNLTRMEGAGSIGADFFRRFHVIFDYPHDRILLLPNSYFDQPFEFNMSGLGIRKTLDGVFEVMRVDGYSPASEAGIRVGDQVHEIDGKPADEYNLHQIGVLFKEEGKRIALSIRRDSIKSTVQLHLRRLI